MTASTRRLTTRRLIGVWLAGMAVGSTIIAATSPLFVRSYVPLRADPIRGVWTLPPGHTYRWRSEGYADTLIGPLGMPGKGTVWPREPGMTRVAIWGDSQAEGVCVSDEEKLCAQAEILSGGRLEVFPLARSGEDAADWVTQMRRVEAALDLDVHAFLVADLSDLLDATEAPLPPPSPSDVAAANASIASKAPALVIQAARNLLTEDDGTTRRRLRFSIGPQREVLSAGHAMDRPTLTESGEAVTKDQENPQRWQRPMEAIRAASSLPILLIYAPVIPQIVNGHVVTDLGHEEELLRMRDAAASAGLVVVDARSRLRQSAAQGRWPHGFQNGYIGSGHLNRAGNAVLGKLLVEQVLDRGLRDAGLSDRGRGDTSRLQAGRD